YEGIVQTICITVESDDTLTRKSQSITGCIDIEVEQEEASEAYFEVSVDSSIGSSTVNPGCDESWSCTEYGDCENGIEERTCTDINQCGTETSNPEEIQSCEEIGFSTNADGNYAVHGVWIDWGLKKYYYNGKSTFRCTSKGATEIGTTPEGYRICTRLGYDIESRVYLDDGNNGLIFK
ncbi:MAG: hypothetical protein KKB31_01460, partial [Nanoarchaeota archaeon]|nr:hypothetical protein [Nanoarchaeota archaeon]